jgi:fermentation-respiration switch protein FrsA (DUF1100 family)
MKPSPTSALRMHVESASHALWVRRNLWIRAPIVAYLLVVLMLTSIQERIIFPATRDPSRDVAGPSAGFRDVYFASDDGVQLHGRYYAAEDARGVLLYFHGNGDMVGWLDGYARLLRDKCQRSVFVFDYRGYGRSDGSPSGPGVLMDGRAAVRQLRELSGAEHDQMIYFGRSLGGGVAIDVALDHPPGALVLQNTFSSMADLAAHHFRWIPMRWLLKVRIDPASQVGTLTCPILQSHGTADTLVPLALGRRLFDAARPPKKFYEILGSGHNDPEPEEFYDVLNTFLDSTSAADGRQR